MEPQRPRSRFSRRQVLRSSLGAVPAAGLLLPGAASAAPGRYQAPAFIRNLQGSQEITHWVYSSLLLDRTSLTRVPEDTTENVIEYFEWSREEFAKVEPDINVKLEWLPHDETWYAKIDASLVAGSPPDVVQGPVSQAAKYVPLGVLSPVDDHMPAEMKEDLVQSVVAESSFNGVNYLWPWRLSFGGGMQINATQWRENGAEELLPTGETRRWLMDDCLEAFRRTTVDTNGDGSPDSYGVVLMTDIHYHVTQFLFGFGARLYNEDETACILNSPEGVAGLEWLIALENEHKVAIPGSAVRKNTEATALFREQRAACYPSQGTGLEPPAMDFEWYWAPPPNVPGAEPAVMTNVQGHYVFQQDSDDRTAAAHRWAEFLVRPEALALGLDQFGQPPARQSLWGAVTDPNQKVGLTFTDMMISFGRRASASTIQVSLMPRMLQAAFTGDKSPQEALDDLVSEANKLIEEAIALEG